MPPHHLVSSQAAPIDRLPASAAASRRWVTLGAGRCGHYSQPVPGGVLDQDGYDVAGGVGVEMPVRVPDHARHQGGVKVRELT